MKPLGACAATRCPPNTPLLSSVCHSGHVMASSKASASLSLRSEMTNSEGLMGSAGGMSDIRVKDCDGNELDEVYGFDLEPKYTLTYYDD